MTMRLALLTVSALAFAATPALAGEMGGGCNWKAKAVTAEAPPAAEPEAMFVSLEPITDKWLLIRDDKTVAGLTRMIGETAVPTN
jgi:hypothetical protein